MIRFISLDVKKWKEGDLRMDTLKRQSVVCYCCNEVVLSNASGRNIRF